MCCKETYRYCMACLHTHGGLDYTVVRSNENFFFFSDQIKPEISMGMDKVEVYIHII